MASARGLNTDRAPPVVSSVGFNGITRHGRPEILLSHVPAHTRTNDMSPINQRFMKNRTEAEYGD